MARPTSLEGPGKPGATAVFFFLASICKGDDGYELQVLIRATQNLCKRHGWQYLQTAIHWLIPAAKTANGRFMM